jgi:hypothetical protein
MTVLAVWELYTELYIIIIYGRQMTTQCLVSSLMVEEIKDSEGKVFIDGQKITKQENEGNLCKENHSGVK